MMKNLLPIVLTIFFCLVLVGRPVCAEEIKGKDPAAERKALFEKKCAQCHAPDRIKEGHRSKEELKQILTRMTSKPACNINATEAKEIELYLLGDIGPAVAPGM